MPISVPAETPLTLTTNQTTLAPDARATQTITLTNNAGVSLNNLLIRDTLYGATFVPGTVTVNGAAQTADNPNTGINIGTLPSGGTTTITYQIQANATPTSIVDIATANFNATDEVTTQNYTVTSNLVIIEPAVAAQLAVTKNVDRTTANVGDVLTYTVFARNTGNTPLTGVTFTDVLPTGVTFVPNSVTINGVTQPTLNPGASFALPDIPANTTTTITFQARANTATPIINTATITATGITDPVTSNVVTTEVQNRRNNCCCCCPQQRNYTQNYNTYQNGNNCCQQRNYCQQRRTCCQNNWGWGGFWFF